MIKKALIILSILLPFLTFSQDTVVDFNGYMYVGKIMDMNQKELFISYQDHDKVDKTERIKIKKLSYCSSPDLVFEKQSIITSNKSVILTSSSLNSLIDSEIIKVKSWTYIPPLSEILPFKNGYVIYSSIVSVDSTSKDELYARAKLWAVNVFKSAIDVIQLDDKQNGTLVCKGYSNVYHAFAELNGPQEINTYFTLSIYIKDGRFRYELNNIKCKWFISSSRYTIGGWSESPIEAFDNGHRKKNTRKLYKQVDERMKALLYDLEVSMKKPTPATQDW